MRWGVWHINPDIRYGVKGGSLNQNLEPKSKLDTNNIFSFRSLVSSTSLFTCTEKKKLIHANAHYFIRCPVQSSGMSLYLAKSISLSVHPSVNIS